MQARRHRVSTLLEFRISERDGPRASPVIKSMSASSYPGDASWLVANPTSCQGGSLALRCAPLALLSHSAAGGLQSATLVLIIAENSNNWGTTGRLVDVHRLFVDWPEGNGRNDVMVGGGPGFRRSGQGVTWHCDNDTNIFNQDANCSLLWNSGSYAPATAANVLHSNWIAW